MLFISLGSLERTHVPFTFRMMSPTLMPVLNAGVSFFFKLIYINKKDCCFFGAGADCGVYLEVL